MTKKQVAALAVTLGGAGSVVAGVIKLVSTNPLALGLLLGGAAAIVFAVKVLGFKGTTADIGA